jgi:hypothetical protein
MEVRLAGRSGGVDVAVVLVAAVNTPVSRCVRG